MRLACVVEQPVIVADPLAKGHQAPYFRDVRALFPVVDDAADGQQFGASVRPVRARDPEQLDHLGQLERGGHHIRRVGHRGPAHRAAVCRVSGPHVKQAVLADHVPIRAEARHPRNQLQANRALERVPDPVRDHFDLGCQRGSDRIGRVGDDRHVAIRLGAVGRHRSGCAHKLVHGLYERHDGVVFRSSAIRVSRSLDRGILSATRRWTYVQIFFLYAIF